MASSTSIPLSNKSQKAFIAYYHSLQLLQNVTRDESRARFEKADRDYQREVDRTEEHNRAKQANAVGDTNRFQNMVVPVVMPQVEAAVVHQTSVYLTGSPLFGVVSSATFMDEALQLESVIESDSIRGGWARHLMLFFRDGFKYNFAPLEVSWDKEVTSSITTDLQKNL
ncbi:MAG: hypothetical protein DRJ63_10140, partial [Thermoprotei archaeon]